MFERLPLREQVYRWLLERIVSGELAPGQRVRDHELAAQLGVSRTPVREALRRLDDEGLVETVASSRSRIAVLDPQTAEESFPVVAALFALAARLAVPRVTADDVAAMRAADADLRACVADGDVVGAIRADDRFHGVLVARAGNGELARTLERLMPKIRRLDLLHFARRDETDAAGEHEALVAAVEAGDGALAARLTEENLATIGVGIGEELRRAAAEGRDVVLTGKAGS